MNSDTITISLDRRFLEHPEAVHVRRVRAAIWVYLVLLSRVPSDSDTVEIVPRDLTRRMGLPEGTIRSWLGHLRRGRYIETRRLNEGLSIRVKNVVRPEAKTEPESANEPPPRSFSVARLARALGESGNEKSLSDVLDAYPYPVIQKALAATLAVPDTEIRRSRTALFFISSSIMTKKPDAILALDPGLRELGFAVLAGRRLLAAGVRPLRLLPQSVRFREARRLVAGWVQSFRPHTIVFETTHRHPVESLHALHRLTRYVSRMARRRRIRIAHYAPQSVRKSVHGHGWATKRQLAEAIAVHYPALRVYLTQDRRWKERFWLNLFDAIGLALHHQRAAKPPSRSRSSG